MQRAATPRAAVAVALLGALAAFWAYDVGSDFIHDYDEGVYLISARLVMHGHPLFRETFSSQPPLYVTLLAAAFRIFGDTVATGRGLSVVAALITCAALAVCAFEELGSARAALIAVIACGTATLFCWQARTAQAEMVALAFSTAALAVLVRPARAAAPRFLALSGVLFGLALVTKLFVAPLAVPLALLALRATRRPQALLVAPLAAVATVAVVCLPFGLAQVIHQSIGFHVDALHVASGRTSRWAVLQFVATREAGLVPAALLGVCASVALRRAGWVLAWLAATLVFLVVHAPLFPHHVVLLVPPLAMLAAAAVSVAATPRAWAVVSIVVLCLAFKLEQKGTAWKPVLPLVAYRHLASAPAGPALAAQQRAVEELASNTRPDDLIMTDSQMVAFRAGRDVPPDLCDTSFVRIAAGSLTREAVLKSAPEAHAILLWSGRLESIPGFTQWVSSHAALKASFDAGDPKRQHALYLSR